MASQGHVRDLPKSQMGVDNVLVNMIDPVFLGLAIDKKVLAAGKSGKFIKEISAKT